MPDLASPVKDVIDAAPVLEPTGGSEPNNESLKPNDERNSNGGMKNEKGHQR
jgi:hypothetical protein